MYMYTCCARAYVCTQKEGQCLHTRTRAVVTPQPDWHYWKQATRTGLPYTHLLFMFMLFLFFFFNVFLTIFSTYPLGNNRQNFLLRLYHFNVHFSICARRKESKIKEIS